MTMTHLENGNYDWAMRRCLELEAEVIELTAVNEGLARDNDMLVAANKQLRGDVRLLNDLVKGVASATTPKPGLHSVKA